MKKQNLAILKLVIALVVVYVVYRLVMTSMDGFQDIANLRVLTPPGNCDFGEVKIIYNEGAADKDVQVVCLKKPAGRNNVNFFPNLTKVFPTEKMTRLTTPANCIKAEIFPEPDYKGTMLVQTGRNDNAAWAGSSKNYKIGSMKVINLCR